MPSKDPADRRLIAAIAAHTSWANTEDRTARTQPGRNALWEKFLAQVDPEGVLPEKERELRAKNAQKAYFVGLARKRWSK